MESSLQEIRLSAFIAALKAELMEAASFGRSKDPDIPEFILAEARVSFFYEAVALKDNALFVSVDVRNLQGTRAKRLSNLTLAFKDEDILSSEAEGNSIPDNT